MNSFYTTVLEMCEKNTKRLSDRYTPDKEKFLSLKTVCDDAEKFAQEICAEGVNAKLGGNGSLVLEIDCDDVVIENTKDSAFMNLLDKVSEFNIERKDEDTMCFVFKYDNLWASKQ